MSRLPPLLAVITCCLGACYAPDLRDCTVTCTAPTDCAGDQVCGDDGFCAHASLAGSCGDDPALVPRIMLEVKVDGVGRVRVHGVGDCDSDDDDDDRITCSWLVPQVPLRVEAIELDDEATFDRWTTTTCTGEAVSCSFTPTAATMIGARFR